MIFDLTSALSILSLVISLLFAVNFSLIDSKTERWSDKISMAIVKKLRKSNLEMETKLTEKVEIDLGEKVVSTDLEKIDKENS